VAPESTSGEVRLPGPGVVTTVGMMAIGPETAKRATGETSATDVGNVGTLNAIAATVRGPTAVLLGPGLALLVGTADLARVFLTAAAAATADHRPGEAAAP